MISSTTPYKLAEIIRDTWPGLYRPTVMHYNNQNDKKDERILDRNRE
jgi:hypothetical protein